MKIVYAYTKPLGFVKVPIDTLKEFKQTYKDHTLFIKEDWFKRKSYENWHSIKTR